MKKKYLIQCKACGKLLFKTEIISVFNTEIRCNSCKKNIKLPEDVVISLDKGSRDRVK
jgi:phage FluMu protein Com